MEVAAFPLAVERIIGRIEVERDADWRLAVRVHEHVHEQPLDGVSFVVELVVPVEADHTRVLRAVERRLAGEHAARPVEHGRECRIEAQSVVVDQVLVPKRLAEDALAQQVRQRVLDVGRTAVVDEAPGHSLAQPDPAVRRSFRSPSLSGWLHCVGIGEHLLLGPKSFSQKDFLRVGAPLHIITATSSGSYVRSVNVEALVFDPLARHCN